MKKTNYKYQTGNLYGNYLFGNLRHLLFSKRGLNKTMSRVLRDLKSSNLTLDELKEYHVMDVGIGGKHVVF